MSNESNDLNKRFSIIIPVTVICILVVLVTGGWKCSADSADSYRLKIQQREQTIREVCGGNVDLKADIARAQACTELVRRQ